MRKWIFNNDWLAGWWMWVALTAYHLVDVPAVPLLAAALPWLVGSLFHARLELSHWRFKLVVLVTALPLAFSL